MDLTPLSPDPILLLFAVFLDGLFGDPVFAWHPIRLMGGTLTIFERMLRRLGLDGYAGGCMLMLLLSAFWIGLICGLAMVLSHFQYDIGWIFQAYIIFSMIALKDLCRHGLAIDRAADPDGARRAVSMLVGRDTRRMDAAACRRAGMESLSENAVDGFVSPIFWYAVLGLPGIVFFKVVSTMDSMVGFRTSQYRYFGWCGARMDDLLNYVPARLTYPGMVVVAFLLPGCSARKALLAGWRQHALVPGPNSGWSEATAAGALQRRLVGPIWQDGKQITDLWLGDGSDPEGGQPGDMRRMCMFVIVTCLFATGLATAYLLFSRPHGLTF